MRLRLVISGVFEVVCALGGCDGVEDRFDCIEDGVGGALCSLAKPVLELGEELFDRLWCSRARKAGEACGESCSPIP
jgi:hypothetical protein